MLTRAEVANLISNILDRGLDLEDLAQISGINVPTIIMIMRGQLRPSETVRVALAEALDINSKVLVD